MFLVQQFIKLATEEAAAINCHMGFSRAEDNSISIGESFHFSPPIIYPKDKRFAAGCDRETIKKGCEMLGMEVRDVAEICIEGMRPYAEDKSL